MKRLATRDWLVLSCEACNDRRNFAISNPLIKFKQEIHQRINLHRADTDKKDAAFANRLNLYGHSVWDLKVRII
jgi:hypothetical protein